MIDVLRKNRWIVDLNLIKPEAKNIIFAIITISNRSWMSVVYNISTGVESILRFRWQWLLERSFLLGVLLVGTLVKKSYCEFLKSKRLKTTLPRGHVGLNICIKHDVKWLLNISHIFEPEISIWCRVVDNTIPSMQLVGEKLNIKLFFTFV